MEASNIYEEMPVSRGSKQKIMKLKEEQTKLHGDPQAFRMRHLKESYDLALVKMNDMNNNPSNNLYVKVHGQKASKAYSALSSIIYASIGLAKIESLENYIRQAVASLPSSMIDLEDWDHVLNMAKECREFIFQQKPPAILPLPIQKQLQIAHFLALNPIRNVKDEIIMLKKNVADILNSVQMDFMHFYQILYQVTSKLRDLQDKDMNAKLVAQLKSELSETQHISTTNKINYEKLLKNQHEHYETLLASGQEEYANLQNEFTTVSASQLLNLNRISMENADHVMHYTHFYNLTQELKQQLADSLALIIQRDEQIDKLLQQHEKEVMQLNIHYLAEDTVNKSLHAIEIATLHHIQQNMSQDISLLQEQKCKHQEIMFTQEESIDNLSDKLTRKENECIHLTTVLQSTQDTCASQVQQIDTLQGEKMALQQYVTQLESETADQKQQITTLTTSNTHLTITIESLEKSVELKIIEIDHLKQSNHSLTQQLSLSTEKLLNVSKLRMNLEQENNNLSEHLMGKERYIEQQDDTLQSYEHEIKGHLHDKVKLKTKILQLEKLIEEIITDSEIEMNGYVVEYEQDMKNNVDLMKLSDILTEQVNLNTNKLQLNEAILQKWSDNTYYNDKEICYNLLHEISLLSNNNNELQNIIYTLQSELNNITQTKEENEQYYAKLQHNLSIQLEKKVNNIISLQLNVANLSQQHTMTSQQSQIISQELQNKLNTQIKEFTSLLQQFNDLKTAKLIVDDVLRTTQTINTQQSNQIMSLTTEKTALEEQIVILKDHIHQLIVTNTSLIEKKLVQDTLEGQLHANLTTATNTNHNLSKQVIGLQENERKLSKTIEEQVNLIETLHKEVNKYEINEKLLKEQLISLQQMMLTVTTTKTQIDEKNKLLIEQVHLLEKEIHLLKSSYEQKEHSYQAQINELTDLNKSLNEKKTLYEKQDSVLQQQVNVLENTINNYHIETNKKQENEKLLTEQIQSLQETVSSVTLAKIQYEESSKLLKEQVKTLEENVLHLNVTKVTKEEIEKSLRQQVNQLEENSKILEEKIVYLETMESTLQGKVTSLQDTLVSLRAQVISYEDIEGNLRAQLASLLMTETALREKMNVLEVSESKLRYEMERLESTEGVLLARIGVLETTESGLYHKITGLESTSSALQSKVNQLESTEESLQAKIIGLEGKETVLQNQLHSLEANDVVLRDRVISLELLSNTLHEKEHQLQDTVLGLTSEKLSLSEIEKALRNQVMSLLDTLTVVNKDKSNTDQMFFNLREEMNTKLHELQSLQNEYFTTQRNVMELKDTLQKKEEVYNQLKDSYDNKVKECDGYQMSLLTLRQEIEHMTDKHIQQLHQYHITSEEMKMELQRQSLEYQTYQATSALSLLDKTNEIVRLNQEIVSLRGDFIHTSEASISSHNNELISQQDEIMVLTNQVQSKEKEYLMYQANKNQELLHKTNDIEQLMKQVNNKESEIIQLKELLTKATITQEMFDKQEVEIVQLSTQIEGFLSDSKQETSSIVTLQNEVNEELIRLSATNKIIVKQEEEIASLTAQIEKFVVELRKESMEIERLKDQIQTISSPASATAAIPNGVLEERVASLTLSLEGLVSTHEQTLKDVAIKDTKIEELMMKVQQMTPRLTPNTPAEEIELLLEKKLEEVTSLHTIIEAKTKELETVNALYAAQLLAVTDGSLNSQEEAEKASMVNKIIDLTTELEGSKKSMQQKERQIIENKNLLAIKQAKIEELNNEVKLLSTKQQTAQESPVQSESTDKPSMAQKCLDLTNELEQLTKELASKDSQLSDQTQVAVGLTAKQVEMNSNIKNLEDEVKVKHIEIEELNASIKHLEGLVKELQEEKAKEKALPRKASLPGPPIVPPMVLPAATTLITPRGGNNVVNSELFSPRNAEYYAEQQEVLNTVKETLEGSSNGGIISRPRSANGALRHSTAANVIEHAIRQSVAQLSSRPSTAAGKSSAPASSRSNKSMVHDTAEQFIQQAIQDILKISSRPSSAVVAAAVPIAPAVSEVEEVKDETKDDEAKEAAHDAAEQMISQVVTEVLSRPSSALPTKTITAAAPAESKEEEVIEEAKHADVVITKEDSTKSITTQGGDPVIGVQAMIRGYLGRAKVKRIRLESLAEAQGILVACHGTKQGETGWYTAQEQLFYFCMHNEEFILVCGPITKDIFELAIEDLQATSPDVYAKLTALTVHKLPKDIAIDRLGLQTTRLQIETLLQDLQLRDEYIESYEIERKEYEEQVNEQAEMIALQANKLAILTIQVQEYAEQMKTLSAIQEKQQLAKVLALKEFQQKISSLPQENIKLEKAFVKLSSIVRGYLGRQKMKRVQLFKLADESGVLVAMKNTIQGESGWYVGPNGSIFYFVLKEGKWIYTAGPLTEQDVRFAFLQKLPTYNRPTFLSSRYDPTTTTTANATTGGANSMMAQVNDNQSVASSLTGTGMTINTNSNSYLVPPEKILTRCAFQLNGLHQYSLGALFEQGEVYLSNASGKLYLGLSIDIVMAEVLHQHSTNNSLIQDIAESSSILTNEEAEGGGGGGEAEETGSIASLPVTAAAAEGEVAGAVVMPNDINDVMVHTNASTATATANSNTNAEEKEKEKQNETQVNEEAKEMKEEE